MFTDKSVIPLSEITKRVDEELSVTPVRPLAPVAPQPVRPVAIFYSEQDCNISIMVDAIEGTLKWSAAQHRDILTALEELVSKIAPMLPAEATVRVDLGRPLK